MDDRPADDTAQRRPGRLRRLQLVLWLAAALAVGAALYQIFGQAAAPDEPASYGDSVGGPFTLIAADGSTFTDRDLAGKPYALFFGFTRCPDVCPTTLARLARLRTQLGDDGMDFAIVFVSVDPEADTPEDIGRYVELFGTPIVGLTGSMAQIDSIVKAYHAFYEKVPLEGGSYTVDHTAGVYLMDGQGRLQSIIDYHEEEPASLAKLQRLVG